MDELTKKNINDKAIEHLKGYISQVTPYFDSFFQKQKQFAARIDPIAVDMVERYADFIGGKRLRGTLTKLGYEIFGGDKKEDILKASSIIELIHGFGLMHDDIMDEDELRRKKPTMHTQYQKVFDENYPDSKRDRELYGSSMGMTVGDLGPFYSNLIIEDTTFDAELKMRFLKRVSEVVIQTVHGQGLDVSFEQENIPNEDKVMLIHKFKTAYYTISGPLQYGAILAGVLEDNKQYLAMESYGIPIGIAFQLRDDELGMFSEQEKFGKPIFSDLRQGKNTVLFSYAFEHATKEQYKFLYAKHGNPDVTADDLVKVNEILVDTGALAYSNKISEELVQQGKNHISEITKDKKFQDLLDLVADFVIMREK